MYVCIYIYIYVYIYIYSNTALKGQTFCGEFEFGALRILILEVLW